MKMTDDSCVLLSVFCSPGTGLTSTLIGTFWPVGGCLLSGIVTVFSSPAAIVGIVYSWVSASPPSPTRTVTTTSVSVFSPWFWTWIWKERSPAS